jgi:hypothetical protein
LRSAWGFAALGNPYIHDVAHVVASVVEDFFDVGDGLLRHDGADPDGSVELFLNEVVHCAEVVHEDVDLLLCDLLSEADPEVL